MVKTLKMGRLSEILWVRIRGGDVMTEARVLVGERVGAPSWMVWGWRTVHELRKTGSLQSQNRHTLLWSHQQGGRPADMSTAAQVSFFQIDDIQNCKMINMHCFEPTGLWWFVTAARGKIHSPLSRQVLPDVFSESRLLSSRPTSWHLQFLGISNCVFWRREWQPTPVFLPVNSMDRETWWATVHGVAKRQTWLRDWSHMLVCFRRI